MKLNHLRTLLAAALDRLRTWSGQHRRRAIVVASAVLIALVAILSASVSLGAATFALVAYGTVFAAVTMLGVKPLEPLPSLEVGLWDEGALVPAYTRKLDRPRAPIDIDACVRNAAQPVRNEIPPELSGLEQVALVGGLLSAIQENQNQAIERVRRELSEFESTLRKWLERYAARRWANYALIEQAVAIHNRGETRADGVILRITLPDDIQPTTRERLEALKMPPPPRAPKYEERSLTGWSPTWNPESLALPQVFPTVRTSAPSSGPEFVDDHGRTVAEVRHDEVAHGVTEQSDRLLRILPTRPGIHELPWSAHVGNLRRPAQGSVRINVEPMRIEGDPLTSLDEVLATGDVPIEGD